MRKSRIVLGVSDSHDAGVALLRDGEIVAALNEERLSRRKQASGTPVKALQRIFEFSGIAPEEVDVVAVAGRASLGAPPLNNDF